MVTRGPQEGVAGVYVSPPVSGPESVPESSPSTLGLEVGDVDD